MNKYYSIEDIKAKAIDFFLQLREGEMKCGETRRGSVIDFIAYLLNEEKKDENNGDD